jgi:hypothetical protein
MTTQTITPSAVEVAEHLQLLLLEAALAEVEGLDANAAYMADLREEITATRDAYLGAAITDIATLRGQLSGRLLG